MLSCSGKPKSQADIDNKKINKELRKEKKKYRSIHRLLLLGPGESGKSTIVKQMLILHKNGFQAKERTEKIPYIRKNARDSILTITGAMNVIDPPVALGDPALKPKLDYIQNTGRQTEYDYPLEFYQYTEDLWKDSGVQECFQRSNEYQLIDCAKYFLDQIMELSKDDYIPTEQDILRCRVLTSGVFETQFTVDKVDFHMFDVGGQRDERRKWIQCFYGITAVIYVAAISSYDQTLLEDENKLRVHESLDVFETTWKNRWLQNISIILFLNKQDILVKKVKEGKEPIEKYFPEYASYSPGSNVQSNGEHPEVLKAKYFFRDKFLAFKVDNKSNRHIYAHFTTAVDTENIRRVFTDCRDIIQRINLEKYELL